MSLVGSRTFVEGSDTPWAFGVVNLSFKQMSFEVKHQTKRRACGRRQGQLDEAAAGRVGVVGVR